jgi:hypothetical protein
MFVVQESFKESQVVVVAISSLRPPCAFPGVDAMYADHSVPGGSRFGKKTMSLKRVTGQGNSSWEWGVTGYQALRGDFSVDFKGL